MGKGRPEGSNTAGKSRGWREQKREQESDCCDEGRGGEPERAEAEARAGRRQEAV